MANKPEQPAESSENKIEDLEVTDEKAAEQVKGGLSSEPIAGTGRPSERSVRS